MNANTRLNKKCLYLCTKGSEERGQGPGSLQQGASLLHSLPAVPQAGPGEQARQAGRLGLELLQARLDLTALGLTGPQTLHQAFQLPGCGNGDNKYMLRMQSCRHRGIPWAIHLHWI